MSLDAPRPAFATAGPPTRKAWLDAGWPAPAGVHALVTLRHGAGASMLPFDRFNLGNARGDAGDDPIIVAANRAELTLRVIVNGAMGVASTTSFDAEEIARTAAVAREAAQSRRA